MGDPPPIEIKGPDSGDLLAGVKALKGKDCEFCGKTLDASTGSYIVTEEGSPKTACKGCYDKQVS